ncbi:MAG: sterol desaturase family protein [Alphaproteobacteria bacterium]|nr:sterol desaturase family protein [Alphaproteobacteria bacterium]
MLATLLAAKAAIISIWFALFFIGERLARADSRPTSSARLFKNFGMWVLLMALSVSVVAPLTAWGANQLLWVRSEWMTAAGVGAALLIIDLILLDCWTYWVHRAYHKVPLMWRVHEIHHRDEFLDTTSAVRFHIGEVVFSALLRLIPISLLAIPLPTVILFEIILFCLAVFHHSNLKLPSGFEKALSWVIVTPSIHWIHHHAIREDTDSNYASGLSVWDRVFGSKSPHERHPNMKIGIEGIEDKGFLALLVAPFLGPGR